MHVVLNSDPQRLSPSPVSGFLFTVGSLCLSFTNIIQRYVTHLQNNPKMEKTIGENLNLQVQTPFIFELNVFHPEVLSKVILGYYM